jgi:hypothetical protein
MSVVSRLYAQIQVWPRGHLVAALWMVITVGVLTGCGGNNDTPATATIAVPVPDITPTATIEPSTPGNFASSFGELGRIVWSTGIDDKSKTPKDRVGSYNHDAAAIYAVLPVARLSPNAQITAEWDYNGTPMPKLTTTINGSDLPDGGWIEFHILRSSNLFWPVGTYHVQIFVNGQMAQEASVTVQNGSQ